MLCNICNQEDMISWCNDFYFKSPFPSCFFLCFKTSHCAQPFVYGSKIFVHVHYLALQVRLTSIYKVVHQNSSWNRGKRGLRIAYWLDIWEKKKIWRKHLYLLWLDRYRRLNVCWQWITIERSWSIWAHSCLKCQFSLLVKAVACRHVAKTVLISKVFKVLTILPTLGYSSYKPLPYPYPSPTLSSPCPIKANKHQDIFLNKTLSTIKGFEVAANMASPYKDLQIWVRHV